MSDRPPRHHWVTLRAGWRGGLLAPPANLAALEAWLAPGRPLVVARAAEGDPPRSLRLGLALPGRRRVGVLVAASAVGERRDPPALEAALGAAPADARPWLCELASRLRRAGAAAAVYGSFAWQHVAADASLVYVGPESDVDLLLHPPTWTAAEGALAALTDASAAHPSPRLDGEVVLPDGSAVAWRELASCADRLLVKTESAARLASRAEVVAAFERRPA